MDGASTTAGAGLPACATTRTACLRAELWLWALALQARRSNMFQGSGNDPVLNVQWQAIATFVKQLKRELGNNVVKRCRVLGRAHGQACTGKELVGRARPSEVNRVKALHGPVARPALPAPSSQDLYMPQVAGSIVPTAKQRPSSWVLDSWC